MSRRSLDQVLLLLAASGHSERAIFEAVQFLIRMGPQASVDRVRRIRNDWVVGHGTGAGGELGYSEASSSAGLDQALRTLSDELRLPAAEIVERVTAGIRGRDAKAEIPEFRPKDGLRRWLQQLARQRSQSEILHIATRIRNEEVQRPGLAWSISKES